jgi:nitrite reductase (NO-forming)
MSTTITPPETRTPPTPPTAPRPPAQTPEPSGSGRALAWVTLVVASSAAVALIVSGLVAPAPVAPVEPAAAAAEDTATDTAAPAEPRSADSIMADPADVGTPVGARAATTVSIELETVELEGQLRDGTTYNYWTFNSTVPGPMVRARVGDQIEFTLANAETSRNVHSIDLHAVNGPHGGGGATQVSPGEDKTFTFTALNPGVYVYHCATAHVPTHIANGMYGLIVIEPEGGLPEVDKEFYVMQGEIYAMEGRGAKGLVGYDGDAMMSEDPTYVVFNGAFHGLTGDHAMQAEVGDRVRVFVGNGGPNLTSSFHVIGEIFDRASVEGGTTVNENVQTTLIPAGGATWVEFTLDAPGDYSLVDHAITRAVDGGALAQIHVEGPANPSVFDAPEHGES